MKNSKKKDLKIRKMMFNAGWIIKTGNEQKCGSPADVYAEHTDKFNENCTILVDDGNVSMANAVYHIYVSTGKKDYKIFEGRIKKPKEFKVVMKVLGFTK